MSRQRGRRSGRRTEPPLAQASRRTARNAVTSARATVVLGSTASTPADAVMQEVSTTTESSSTSTIPATLERCARGAAFSVAQRHDTLDLAGRHEALPRVEEPIPLPHRQHRQAVGAGWGGGASLSVGRGRSCAMRRSCERLC